MQNIHLLTKRNNGDIVGEDEECDNYKKGNGLYTNYARLLEEFEGVYKNCKRGDRGAQCTIRDVDGNTKVDKDEELEMVDRLKSRRARLRTCRDDARKE
jgi:hypothetical protein